MSDIQYDFGMVGLGVMGSNLMLNMADKGFAAIGYDTNPEKTTHFEASATPGTKVKGVNSLASMVQLLKKPRKLMMLVPAGHAVDSVLQDLLPLLEKDDIVIDGGNSHYTDTLRRISTLKDKGFHFMGVGISGGEEGARTGPSIMPGGDEDAYREVEPLLEAISAHVGKEPCVAYLGKDAAGHYVKMVHNGIEYSIMQLISECYDLLKKVMGYSNAELQDLFHSWNQGPLQSFLLEITASIFAHQDQLSPSHDLLDMIADKAGAKGTGQWTSQEGLDLPMPIPNIDAAVMVRNLSSLVEQRSQAADRYGEASHPIKMDRKEFASLLFDAFYFATILSYAQGLALLTRASEELKMEIPLPEVVRVWRGGCIIRSALLDSFRSAYQNPDLVNLLLDENISALLKQKLNGLTQIVALAAQTGIPAPGMMSALNYFNAYRRKFLPTNLIQAQRDYFGAHTYQRTDRPGIFHTQW